MGAITASGMHLRTSGYAPPPFDPLALGVYGHSIPYTPPYGSPYVAPIPPYGAVTPYAMPYGYGGLPPYGGQHASGESPSTSPILRAGRIQVRVEPIGAEVYIDGGPVPVQADGSHVINLLAGRHHLQVLHKGFKPHEQELSVMGGSGVVITLQLEPTAHR